MDNTSPKQTTPAKTNSMKTSERAHAAECCARSDGRRNRGPALRATCRRRTSDRLHTSEMGGRLAHRAPRVTDRLESQAFAQCPFGGPTGLTWCCSACPSSSRGGQETSCATGIGGPYCTAGGIVMLGRGGRKTTSDCFWRDCDHGCCLRGVEIVECNPAWLTSNGQTVCAE